MIYMYDSCGAETDVFAFKLSWTKCYRASRHMFFAFDSFIKIHSSMKTNFDSYCMTTTSYCMTHVEYRDRCFFVFNLCIKIHSFIYENILWSICMTHVE